MSTEPNQPPMPGLFELAVSDGTPKRALITALVVGTVLALINHGDTIVGGAVPPLGKVLLTYCVPYCVATWGAVTGKRALLRKAAES